MAIPRKIEKKSDFSPKMSLPASKRTSDLTLSIPARLLPAKRVRLAFMRIGIAQINTIVGDLAGNRKKIIEAYQKLSSEGADFVVFPELAVCGYPPRDLL